MLPSILDKSFDSSALVDSGLNTPFDPDKDVFYSSLLGAIRDKRLRESVIRLRDHRTSLNNLSHTVYLLPWAFQPHTANAGPQDPAAPPSDRDGALKLSRRPLTSTAGLGNYIRSAKRASSASCALLSLRLSGFCDRGDLVYLRLREVLRSGRPLRVLCRVRGQAVTLRGRLVFFDVDLNLLLLDRAISYVRLATP